jgi:hypothetical protein
MYFCNCLVRPLLEPGVTGSGEEKKLSESARMVDGAGEPTEVAVAEWIGARNFARWADLRRFIGTNYPGVFNIEWLFGGKKHGWAMNVKRGHP